MVDLSKPVMCAVDFKDYYKQPRTCHIHIDIVLLDKTTSPLDPCLYQLNDPDNALQDYIAFNRLGAVISIDAKKKVIALADGNIITYQHMVIATGEQSSWMHPMPGKEFAAGIQLLMEALKMQEKKPPSNTYESKKGKIRPSEVKDNICQAVPTPPPLDHKIHSTKDPKRVYQVQL